MKVIRTVDTFAWHCQTYYGLEVQPPSLPARPKRPRKFDPLNWKNNDLYAILGLESKRHEATAEEIRAAYRTAILVYHPDKQAQRADSEDDSHFKILQKAFAVLSDPERRQQYDSVDFDESVPKTKEYPEEEFWETFPRVFERNSRFSVKRPVPGLCRQMGWPEIEHFYEFWFNFESWRRFEFLDEEEVESGERAEKRYVEKKNKAARLKRKTEDNARISKLVEVAYKNDPRIRTWREEERRQKELKKQANTKRPVSPPKAASPVKQEVDKRRREDQIRQAMAAANEAKNQKKVFRGIFTGSDYFCNGDAKKRERVSLLMEQAILKLGMLELRDLGEEINMDKSNAVELLETRLLAGKDARSDLKEETTTERPSAHAQSHNWTAEQLDLLIKTVKLIPPGIPDRWVRITEHVCRSFPVTHEDVVRAAEGLKAGKVERLECPLNKKRDPRVDTAEPTILVREDAPNALIDLPWTTEDQALLEMAMKAIGPEVEDRWARIAEEIGRPRADVVKRVREIAKRLKKK